MSHAGSDENLQLDYQTDNIVHREEKRDSFVILNYDTFQSSSFDSNLHSHCKNINMDDLEKLEKDDEQKNDTDKLKKTNKKDHNESFLVFSRDYKSNISEPNSPSHSKNISMDDFEKLQHSEEDQVDEVKNEAISKNCAHCLNPILDNDMAMLGEETFLHSQCCEKCSQCGRDVEQGYFSTKPIEIDNIVSSVKEVRKINKKEEDNDDVFGALSVSEEEDLKSMGSDKKSFRLQILCRICTDAEAEKCHKCNNGFLEDENVIEAGDYLFHKGCFKCADCDTLLDDYHEIEDEFICNNCFIPECIICKIKIQDEYYKTVRVQELAYAIHNDCSRCQYCGIDIKILRIDSLIEKLTCPKHHTILNGRLCVSCESVKGQKVAAIEVDPELPDLFVHDLDTCLRCAQCDKKLPKNELNLHTETLKLLCNEHFDQNTFRLCEKQPVDHPIN